MKKLMVVALAMFFFAANSQNSTADDFGDQLTTLGESLSSQIKKSKLKNIAIADFVDLKNETNELGRLLAEEITTALIGSGGDFSVVDRANLRLILEEHKLSASGLIDPSNVRQLGKIAGVDAILVGSVSMLGDTIRVNARVISTESAKAVAAKSIAFDATDSMKQMFGQVLQAENSKKENDSSLSSKKKSQDFKGDLVSAHFEKGRVVGNKMQIVVTMTNTTSNPLWFHLDSSDKSVIFQSSSGLTCESNSDSTKYSLLSNNYYDKSSSYEMAPDESIVFSVKELECDDGEFELGGPSTLTVGFFGKYDNNTMGFSIRLQNVGLQVNGR